MNDNIWGKIGSFLMRIVIAVFGDKRERDGGFVEQSEKVEPRRLVMILTKSGLFAYSVDHCDNLGYIVNVEWTGYRHSHVMLLEGGKIYGSPLLSDGTPKYIKWIKGAGWTGDEILLDSVPDGDSKPMAEGGVITGGNPDSVFGVSAGTWKADEAPKDYNDEVVTNETISR